MAGGSELAELEHELATIKAEVTGSSGNERSSRSEPSR
jgi:hypothetical protein